MAGGWISVATAGVLVLMSVLSLASIVRQVIELGPWSEGEAAPVWQEIEACAKRSALAGSGLSPQLKAQIDAIAARDSGQSSLLASIGANAPYVGLFGTVAGIYSALHTLGNSAAVTIQQISVPIGEALVMTALGLIVAIPAVIGFNVVAAMRRRRRALLEAHALAALGIARPADLRLLETRRQWHRAPLSKGPSA